MDIEQEPPGAEDQPDRDELRRRWEALDRADLSFEDAYQRLQPVLELLEQSKRAGAEELASELHMEACLISATLRGAAEGIDPENIHPDLKTPDGLAFLAQRTQSPSVIVRALSSHTLWIVDRQFSGRRGRDAGDAYLQWFELAIRRTADDASISWAIQATNALHAAAKLAIETGQRDLQRRLAVSAVAESARVHLAGMGRWALECAEVVTRLADRVPTDLDVKPMLDVLGAMAIDNTQRGNFHLARGFVETEMNLRGAIRLQARKGADWNRIAQLYEMEAESASRRDGGGAIAAIHFYECALQAYERAGAPEEIRRVRELLQKTSEASIGELKQISVTVPIDGEQLERLFRGYDEHNIAECIEAIAHGPLWRLNVEVLREQQGQLDDEFVFQRLFPHSLLGPEGTQRRPGPEEADQFRLHRTAMLQFGITMQWLAEIFRRLQARNPQPSVFVDRLLLSNLFGEEDRPFLDRGLAHYLASDHLSAMHVLVPTIERVLRRLARLMGQPTIRARRDGVEHASLDTVLAVLAPAIDAELMLELRLVLSDGAGWSLRHQIAHGLARADTFNPVTSAAVIHLLLWLATLSVQSQGTGENPPRHPESP